MYTFFRKIGFAGAIVLTMLKTGMSQQTIQILPGDVLCHAASLDSKISCLLVTNQDSCVQIAMKLINQGYKVSAYIEQRQVDNAKTYSKNGKVYIHEIHTKYGQPSIILYQDNYRNQPQLIGDTISYSPDAFMYVDLTLFKNSQEITVSGRNSFILLVKDLSEKYELKQYRND